MSKSVEYMNRNVHIPPDGSSIIYFSASLPNILTTSCGSVLAIGDDDKRVDIVESDGDEGCNFSTCLDKHLGI